MNMHQETVIESSKIKELDLSNTEIAFSDKSNKELNKAYWLFRLMKNNLLVKVANKLALISIKMKLPVKWIVRRTVFAHFCGGEDINDCQKTRSALFILVLVK